MLVPKKMIKGRFRIVPKPALDLRLSPVGTTVESPPTNTSRPSYAARVSLVRMTAS